MKTKHIFPSLTVIFLVAAILSHAQVSLQQIVGGSVSDMNILVKGYADPALKSIGFGLNQGWYNTAKPHKIGGVDLTMDVSFVGIPNSDLSYYVDNNKLQTIELINGPGGSVLKPGGYAPTIFGSSEPPRYREKMTGTEFDGAPGADLSQVPVIKNSVPIPMVQLGVGLPKGFEVKLRYTPTINFGDNNRSNFSLFGIGLMHDVKRYIPGIKMLPFDLSAFIGYTKMKLNVAVDPTNHPDQIGMMESRATTIQGIISKKFSVLTGYAGLGYNFVSSKLLMSGTYDLLDVNGSTVSVKDPVSDNVSVNGARATFGLRLKLAVFTFHGDYTFQKYSTLTLGFGISVR